MATTTTAAFPNQALPADVVVIGRIENYRIVRDESIRKEMLASSSLSPEDRKFYEDPKTGLLPDYARFDIKVEELLILSGGFVGAC